MELIISLTNKDLLMILITYSEKIYYISSFVDNQNYEFQGYLVYQLKIG